VAIRKPTLDIAVINDKKAAADAIVRDLRQLGCNAEPIVALTTPELYNEVRTRLTSQEKQYDGVVLDIGFLGDPLGGIELWKLFMMDEITPLLGGLMVLSNTNEVEVVTSYFSSIGQPILVLSGATTSARRRPQDLQLFMDQIRRA
jgi:hypothetical protein